MKEIINRVNVDSIINVSLGNPNDGYHQYSFYIESGDNSELKYNTVIAVAKMLSPISIYAYNGVQVSLIDPNFYRTRSLIDETYLNMIYDSLTKGDAVNIFI